MKKRYYEYSPRSVSIKLLMDITITLNHLRILPRPTSQFLNLRMNHVNDFLDRGVKYSKNLLAAVTLTPRLATMEMPTFDLFHAPVELDRSCFNP